jgi:hypothetical protein
MRRATILRLLGVVLLIGFAAYSAYWWIAAGRIKLAAGDWAQAAHARQLDVAWQTIRVSGYPFAFRLELGDPVLTDKAANPPVEVRAPALSVSAWPWNFHALWLTAPTGIGALFGPGSAPLARLDAEAADGAVALGDDGRVTIWLTLVQPKAEAGVAIGARAASAWIILPPRSSPEHAEPELGVAALIDGIAIPAAPLDFSKTIEQLGVGATLTGKLPAGPLKDALSGWRDAGGTLVLDHLDLRWGALGVTGSGTLALDADLQPVGSLTGAISGYDQLMNALVAAGRIKASDARVARLALAMLGRVGPDGRPEIATSLRVQNGEMFLGPAKLGRIPSINW